MTPEDFFSGSPEGLAVYLRVHELLTQARPGVVVRTSTSQVAFRRRRGFAYLWRPRQYLRHGSQTALSIALPREASSERFKEVAHPAPAVWMHHLEIGSVDDVDHEVEMWLLEAADAAAVVRADGGTRG
jgi:hypothetical protein